VYVGWIVSITVIAENQGNFSETFSVTVYANATIIQIQTVTDLAPSNQTTLVFYWDTSGFAEGNYTIKAVADTVLGETDTADNTITDGWVVVMIPGGDFNGDGSVDGSDFFILLQAWGTSPPSDPRADANGDGLVDGSDFYVLLVNWGKSDS
jgi:hypothetical protein